MSESAACEVRSSCGAGTQREVAFIDPAVPAIHDLLAGLRPEVEPILLSGRRSAAEEIAAALPERGGKPVVHLIAHGAPGHIGLMAGEISVETLGQSAALGRLAGCEIRLWSCRTGAGPAGQSFLRAFAAATGARVYASSHPVGAPALGGSWRLDGAGASASPLTAAGEAAYPGLLPIEVDLNGVTAGVQQDVTRSSFPEDVSTALFSSAQLVPSGGSTVPTKIVVTLDQLVGPSALSGELAGFSYAWDAAARTLTIETGNPVLTTLEQWNDALAAVKYLEAYAPSGSTRLFTVDVYEGAAKQASPATLLIDSWQSNDDAPIITAPATFAAMPGTPAPLSGLALADPDAETQTTTLVLSVDAGELSAFAPEAIRLNGLDEVANYDFDNLFLYQPSPTELWVFGDLSRVQSFLDSIGQPGSPNTLAFTGGAGATGPVTLSLAAQDIGNFGPTKAVPISLGNLAPEARPIPDQTSAEDSPWTFMVPAGTFVDPDGQSLSYAATLADGSALPAWLAFDETTQTFSGTPPENYAGSFSIKVVASDGADAAASVFTWTISPVNDEPLAPPTQSVTVAEDETLGPVATGATDSDSPLAYTIKAGAGPSSGEVALTADGSFTYVPKPDFFGTDTFTVEISDGQSAVEQVVTVTVTPQEDPLMGTVAINGPDGQPLAGPPVEGMTLAAEGQNVTDADGTATITYQWFRDGALIASTDGSNGDATYTLTADDVGHLITVQLSATDPQGATGTLTSAPTPAVVGLNDPPTLSPGVTAAAAFEQQPTLLMPDLGLSDSDSTTLLVARVRIENYVAGEDVLGLGGPIPAGIEASWDATTGTLVLTTALGETSMVGDFESALRHVRYTNLSDSPSPVPRTVRVTVIDPDGTAHGGHDKAVAEFTFAVSPVNDVPKAGGAPAMLSVGVEDKPYTVLASDLLAGFTDADGDTLAVANLKVGAVALTDNGDGTWTYVPPADLNGPLTLTYEVTDHHGGVVPAAKTFTLLPVNDAPAVSGSGSLPDGTEDAPYAFSAQTLLDGLSDPDGDPLSVFGLSTSSGTLTATATGWILTPGKDFAGPVTLSYTILDGKGAMVPVTRTVTFQNVEDGPTGAVVVTGPAKPQQGDQLTAQNTLSDPDGMGPVTYEWLRDGAPIPGATGTTYTLTAGDVGKAISIRATYVDGAGATESMVSAETPTVLGLNTPPELSLNLGPAAPVQAFEQQAQVIAPGLSLTDGDGTTTLLVAKVQISGNYQAGEDVLGLAGPLPMGIEASWDAWSGTLRLFAAAGQAPTLADFEAALRAVTYTNTSDAPHAAKVRTITFTAVDPDGTVKGGANTAVETLGLAVANVNDVPTGGVTIAGPEVPKQGDKLTASNALADLDGLGPVSYQWLRDGEVIDGATGKSYVLTQNDVGKAISVRASYVDAYGTPEAKESDRTEKVANVDDPPSGTVQIDGPADPQQGDQLAAMSTLSDADGPAELALSYQWLRNGGTISGATGATYTLTQDDVGAKISVRAIYTDAGGKAEAVTSQVTASVRNLNDGPVGAPAVAGLLAQNQMVQADVSKLFDADGLGAFSFQWMRDDGSGGFASIAEATQSTYVLTEADVGRAIKLAVTYRDGGGTLESVESLPTGPVANVPDKPLKVELEGGSAAEYNAKDKVVGTLKVTDPDQGDTFTFRLLDGADGRFGLSGDKVVVVDGFRLDFEQAASHTIKVEVEDSAGLTRVETLTIAVTDLNPEVTAGTARNDTFWGGALVDRLGGGLGNDFLKGFGGGDTLNGGAGNDRLWGGLGKDLLIGGKGKDAFVFDTKPNRSNVDRIKDYNVRDDTIWLDNAVMPTLGKGTPQKPLKLWTEAFWIGERAHDASDRVIYNAATGALYYDQDGTGAKAQVQIAILPRNLKMTHAEFFVI